MNTQRNLVIFRLACCCGLRVSEISQLCLGDVVIDSPRPHLALRATTTKGKRARRVPLWWDSGTLADVTAWLAVRRDQALVAAIRSFVRFKRIGLATPSNVQRYGAGCFPHARFSALRPSVR